MDESAKLVESLRELLDEGRNDELAARLPEAHAADIARLLADIPQERRVPLFRLLTREQAGDVLPELDDQVLLDLVEALEEKEVSQVLDTMPPEEAADVVEELPSEQAESILDLMQTDKSEEVQELLDYPEESAGRLMSPNVVAVPDSASVAQAMSDIRKMAPESGSFEVFVIDDHRHLVGVVPLRRLLTADPASAVNAITNAEVVTVAPETDQEEVARIVAKYDLVAIPVVDRANRLLGTISVEDVVDIVGHEASEDIFRLAGSDAAELDRRSPRRIALMRLPWILTTLLIELCAGLVIHYYDETLSRVILLASFMPVIQAISGNTGLQSVTMVVRGLATGHIVLQRWWEPLVRQVQTTSIIGVVCGALIGIVGALWHGTALFGVVVGVSMFVSVNLSGLAGTAIPMLSKRMGFDPALTAGPFETALQDVIGVSIFLSLATALLRWLT
ncbi:MAG TPA: magnesium transporter [Methylomirabilota bacterium]|nr:magnesium transporter [Methylomirabilota bacterium]